MTDGLSEEIVRHLNRIKRQAEEFLGITLKDDLLDDCLPHVAHVFLHELCHEAVNDTGPWAGIPEEDLDPLEDQAVEVTVIILERSLSKEVGLHIHTPEEVAQDLSGYTVKLSPAEISELQNAWEQRFRANNDIAGLAGFILDKLRQY